jgi:hypothetical protein
MLAEVLYPYGGDEYEHTQQPGEESRANPYGVTESMVAAREQQYKEEGQQRRERYQPNQGFSRH